MIENALDVIRVFCLLFCGPFIMVECIMSVVYYNKILNGCSEIPDAFTNILVYILIILGCISLTVTAFCFYMTFLFGKTIKECWPELRNPAREEDESLNSSHSEDQERNNNNNHQVSEPDQVNNRRQSSIRPY